MERNKIFNLEQALGAAELEINSTDTHSVTDSEISELIEEATNHVSENFQCDLCAFQSKKMNGLKIHVAKKHKIKL